MVEYVHHQIGAKTSFASHDHQLTELAGRLPRLRNFNVAVREWNDQIIFLRKIVSGGADKSYGIQVARLAGLPKEILDRAKEILAHLERPNGVIETPPVGKSRNRRKPAATPDKPQLDLL